MTLRRRSIAVDARAARRLVTRSRRIKERSADALARAAWLAAVATVAGPSEISIGDLLHTRPRHAQGEFVRRVQHARRIAFYLAVTVSGLGQSRIARAAGVFRQEVHKACHRIEDMRDDPAVDQGIEVLEQKLAGVI